MSEMALENLYVAATADSPEVDFRFKEHLLSLKGESYPENAAAFYGDIIAKTRTYLAQVTPSDYVTVNIALAYFNSSSTKMLFSLFDALNGLAKAGTRVVMNWHHDPDDDTIQEFGFELRDDFAALEFHDMPTES
jgi:SiaC family regulatory phosphoprotein